MSGRGDSVRPSVAGALLAGCCVACRVPGRALCTRCVPLRPTPVTVAGPLRASGTGGSPTAVVGGVPVVTAGRYDGPLGAAVRAAKYGAAAGVVADLADRLAAVVGRVAPAGPAPCAIVPVPTDPRRRRRRGHDPVLHLAVALGARTGLPVDTCVVCAPGRRVHAGADAASRRRPDPYRYLLCRAPPSSVLVVDDVVTTGATLAAVCRVVAAGGGRPAPFAVAAAGRD